MTTVKISYDQRIRLVRMLSTLSDWFYDTVYPLWQKSHEIAMLDTIRRTQFDELLREIGETTGLRRPSRPIKPPSVEEIQKMIRGDSEMTQGDDTESPL